MNDYIINISIPADDDGYVLLKCPKCGEMFKLKPSDIESDDVKDILCPLCGLTSESFLNDDIIDYARTKIKNQLEKDFYNEMKKLEKKTKNSIIHIKASKYKEEYETTPKSTINSMKIVDFDCCNKTAKIRYLLNFCGCYCPFCGVKRYGNN